MANRFYNYYGVQGDYTWHYKSTWRANKWSLPSLFTLSDLVWQEGPNGGVRLIFQSWETTDYRALRYITTDPEAMKEFMWIKLKAQSVTIIN